MSVLVRPYYFECHRLAVEHCIAELHRVESSVTIDTKWQDHEVHLVHGISAVMHSYAFAEGVVNAVIQDALEGRPNEFFAALSRKRAGDLIEALAARLGGDERIKSQVLRERYEALMQAIGAKPLGKGEGLWQGFDKVRELRIAVTHARPSDEAIWTGGPDPELPKDPLSKYFRRVTGLNPFFALGFRFTPFAIMSATCLEWCWTQCGELGRHVIDRARQAALRMLTEPRA